MNHVTPGGSAEHFGSVDIRPSSVEGLRAELPTEFLKVWSVRSNGVKCSRCVLSIWASVIE